MKRQSLGSLNSKVWNILIGTIVTRTALFMSTPFLAMYLSDHKQISVQLTGYVLGINPLANVLFSGFGGALADRLPARRTLSVVPVCWGIIFILFFYADSFWQFLLLSGLNGLCYAIFEPASKKQLSIHSPKEQHLLVFNLRYAAINIGAFAGPLLSLLLRMDRTLLPYVLLGVSYILYGLSTMYFFRDLPASPGRGLPRAADHPRRSAFAAISGDTVFLLLLAGTACSFFGYSQLNASVSQYVSGSPVFTNGLGIYSLLLSANAIIILAAQYFVLAWMQGRNPFTVLITGNLLIGLSFPAFLLPSASLAPWLFILLFSLGELLLSARFDALVNELAPPEEKGLYFGCAESIKAGTILGPVCGTYLLAQFGLISPLPIFGILGGVTVAGSLFLGMAKRRHGKQQQKPKLPAAAAFTDQ